MASAPREDPRTIRSRDRIHGAAREELVERGWGGFRMDGVARRAGVSRSTLYRHYADRSSLVTAALADSSRQPPPIPDEDPRERVLALLRHLAEAMVGPPGELLPALVHGASQDELLAELLHRFSGQRRAALTQAIEEGPWHVDDPDLVATCLSAAVIYRRLMTPSPMEPHEVEQLLGAVLG